MLSFTTTFVNVTFPLFVTVTLYVITSFSAYFPSPSASVPSTAFTTSTVLSSSSTSVVTSSDGVSPTVAVFLTSPANMSASVTVCVNVTSPDFPGFISAIVCVFSFELLSFTTTFIASTLPIFVTVTLYVITSFNAYFPSLFASVPSTVFTTSTPSVCTTSGVSCSSFSPNITTFSIAPFTFRTLVVKVNSIVSPASNVTSFPAIKSFANTSSSLLTSKIPSLINCANLISFTTVVPFILPVFVTDIVYVIVSPTLATSTVFPSLVMTLVLSVFMIDVSVLLLSSPLAKATFSIVSVAPSSTVTWNCNVFTSFAPKDIAHLNTTLPFASVSFSGAFSGSVGST